MAEPPTAPAGHLALFGGALAGAPSTLPWHDIDDGVIRDAIDALLDHRRAGGTVCPSDVARLLVADEIGWRALMPRVRAVAEALARAGRLRVTRQGVEVDATSAGGPIRLGRLRPKATT